jgi:predicted nucleic acid-binding protein
LICIDTNVFSELMRPRPSPHVEAWFRMHDQEIHVSTIVIAEISFGIERLRPAERSPRLEPRFANLLQHFEHKILDFDLSSSLIHGALLGERVRAGRTLATLDAMVAAVALRNTAQLATRNTSDFEELGLNLINPWD